MVTTTTVRATHCCPACHSGWERDYPATEAARAEALAERCPRCGGGAELRQAVRVAALAGAAGRATVAA